MFFITLTYPAFCLYLLIISNNIIRVSVNGEESTSSWNPPDISLTRYQHLIDESYEWTNLQEGESAPDFPVRDGDDYTVGDTENTTGILLQCHAPYPVYWEMTDVNVTPVYLKAVETNSKAIIDTDAEWTSTEIKEFISYLTVPNDASFTGLYTCRSVENVNLNKSTYLFLPGFQEEAKTLLDAGNELNVSCNGSNVVIIPCKISKKNSEVVLAKKDGAGSWTPLTLKTSFDPKSGFTIDKSEVESMIGNYKCSVAEPSEEEVIVNVVQESRTQITFPFKNKTDGVATWGHRKGLLVGAEIECCSNNSTPPSLLVIKCQNTPECDMKQVGFMQNVTTTETTGAMTTESDLNGSCTHTVDDVGIFVRPFLVQCSGDGIDVSGQYATEFSSPVNNKMNFVMSSSIENITYNEETTIRLQTLKWESATSSISNEVYEVHHFRQVDLNESYLVAGEKFVIDCCGLHYHHAIGRMQRIVWKNGTKTKLETPEKDEYESDKEPYLKDFCFTYAYDKEDMEYLVTADENMSYFECIVPRWYDRKPTVKLIPLNIKEPKEPVIASSEEVVNVTFNENQLGLLQLECKLSEGAPRPQMAWKKNSFKFNQTDKYWSMINDNTDPYHPSLNVLFMRATKAIEGKYECSANNSEGKALKIFIVKVNPRSYLDYWIALIGFGGFFAVIICCGLRISTLEKQMTPKQVEPLNSGED